MSSLFVNAHSCVVTVNNCGVAHANEAHGEHVGCANESGIFKQMSAAAGRSWGRPAGSLKY